MSSIEQLSERYADELADFLPVSSVISSIAGIAVLGVRNTDGQGGVAVFLSTNAQDVWYLRELLFRLEAWQVLLILLASVLGTGIAKSLSKKAISKGTRSSENLKRVFSSALELASSDSALELASEAAEAWKKSRQPSVWWNFKLASLLWSLAIVSILSFATWLNWSDVAIAFGLMAFAILATWKFSTKYFVAYLPQRVIIDARLGLLEPRLNEDLAE